MKNVLNTRSMQSICYVIAIVIASFGTLLCQSTLQPLPPIVLPSTCSQQNCSPQSAGYPSPYIYPYECSIGIERYLSRSIEMGGLANFNFKSSCWGLDPLPPADAQVNCIEPYNLCESIYCPDKYCALIEGMVALDAQFIRNAYSAGAYHEQDFYREDPWYALGYQVVTDINHAYDCAGKERPVIQGFVGEVSNPKLFEEAENATDGKDRHIPQALIDKYFEYFPIEKTQIDPDGETSTSTYEDYYYSQPRYFKANRIANKVAPDKWELDITKLEMRMWFLYQAITLIDFGYTAIHMGLYRDYAKAERPTYERLYALTNAFRQYASSQGKFVLLSGEVPYDNIDGGLSATVGGTDNLIFDFDSRAMRPREISNPQVSGDGDGCNGAISPGALDLFNNPNSACFGEQYPAVVDPCTINSAGGSIGGVPPALDGSGPNPDCTYEQVPYVIHYDGFSGVKLDENGNPIHQASNGPDGLTWGFDDHRWLAQLSPDCRRAWFQYFYCTERNYHGGHGYIPIPGIISMNFNENNGDPGPGNSDGKLLFTDDTEFVNEISGFLTPLEPYIFIEEITASPNECQLYCRGEYAGAGLVWLTAPVYYRVTIRNKDCSSVYSIHAKDPNGNWLPQVIGDTMYIYPTIEGEYEIGVRQDNLGLPPETYGTRTVTKTRHLYTEKCYDKFIPSACAKKLTISGSCQGEYADRFTFAFEIESTDANRTVQNVRPIDEKCKIISINYLTNGFAQGIADVYDKQNPRLEFMVDATLGTSPEEFLIREYLAPCIGQRSDRQKEGIGSHLPASFDIFPNPANERLQIKYHSIEGDNIAITCFNAFGQMVYTDNLMILNTDGQVELDISRFPSGIYTIQLTGAKDMRLFGKFVKQKN